ncbi:MAG TPA: hypothetical protein VLJ68_04405 [Chitinophagaceae bacterium]|nr:hypothetical protein [Chitinophagaceae bacterium]
MVHPVVKESKHILKRILIGVATGVSGAAIIYFLGYNRHPKVSEEEIKKNTIRVWKTFVEEENNMITGFDSSVARLNRSLFNDKEISKKKTALQVQRNEDSLLYVRSLDGLEKFRKTKHIDESFAILLGTRIAYQKEHRDARMDYESRFSALILDSTRNDFQKNQEILSLNEDYNKRMQNLTERIGRSIEDLSSLLTKKFEYSFSMDDFRFNPFYQTLKKAKSQQPKPPEVAPNPDKKKPDLPN